ncbi:hypothetical protein [Streptomyces sp. NPDC001787]|uniref:hypothetical protein n=1 Tax=Streptomyces sp. NPDC001787 TaxID=3154523 RepID=UPI0033301272
MALEWELKNVGTTDNATSVTAAVRLPDTLDFTTITGTKGTWSTAGGTALGSAGTLKPCAFHARNPDQGREPRPRPPAQGPRPRRHLTPATA